MPLTEKNYLSLDKNGNPASGGYNRETDKIVPFNTDSEGNIFTKTVGGNGVNTDISTSAWGIPIFNQEYSIFHSLFTYDVNGTFWKGIEDGTENLDLDSSTRIISEDGGLNAKTTATNGSCTQLISFRSPRYQPNRGHKYSTTVFSEDIDVIGAEFEWGLGYSVANEVYTGCFFRVKDARLYAVIMSFGVEKYAEDITDKTLEILGLTSITQLEKGTLYDIQFQWRGVGNYFFYINLKLVHTVEFLGTLDRVSMENPQLPAFYRVCNKTAGQVLNFRSGCIDISSEGGQKGNLSDASPINNDLVTIPNDINRHALLIARVTENYKGKVNTRNSRLLRLTATPFGKDMRSGFGVTRDTSIVGGTIGNTAFIQVRPGSSLEYIDMSLYTETEVSFDFNNVNLSIPYKSSGLSGIPIIADESNPDLDLYLSAGDIIVLFVQNVKTGTGGEAEGILEFGEEI